jgi:UDP-4-amino-4,6-dideoxy-N-acetyl-beta-L-altrosamine transaminase
MFIPYSKQSINNKDIEAVKKALRSEFLTQGSTVGKFENQLTKFTKSKYATVVNSATSGLYIACRVLDLKKNDEVWTSSNTFVATASSIIHTGAKVKFLDIDKTGNINVKKLENKLIFSQKKKKLPKAIIIVHFSGQPCYPKEIFSLSKKFKFKIIEDASHALGAYYDGIPVGSCKHSDMCIFSFHAIKSITTGEGGCVTTNNYKYYKELNKLRSHGITKEKKDLILKKKSKFHWYYEVKNISFNFRLTDFQCALGISQLKRLDSFIKKRKILAKRYLNSLDKNKYELPSLIKGYESSWHLFVIKVKNNRRDAFYKYLNSKKISSVLHYIPVFLHPYYRKKNKNKNFKQTIEYYKNAVSIPLFVDLKKKQQDYVIKQINEFK